MSTESFSYSVLSLCALEYGLVTYVRFTLTKMTIVYQTQLTPSCFEYDKAALSAPSLVGELSVTLRDLPHTLFGSLASNAAPIRYNLRIVTDIAIVGPRTLATAGA